MSKPKIWTLAALLDRIWMLSRGKRTAVETIDKVSTKPPYAESKVIKRVVTGWDEDYKPRTYELNKISAASAAALYERIKEAKRGIPETDRPVEFWCPMDAARRSFPVPLRVLLRPSSVAQILECPDPGVVAVVGPPNSHGDPPLFYVSGTYRGVKTQLGLANED